MTINMQKLKTTSIEKIHSANSIEIFQDWIEVRETDLEHEEWKDLTINQENLKFQNTDYQKLTITPAAESELVALFRMASEKTGTEFKISELIICNNKTFSILVGGELIDVQITEDGDFIIKDVTYDFADFTATKSLSMVFSNV